MQMGAKFWARKISGSIKNIEIEVAENQIVEVGDGINSGVNTIKVDPNIK